VNPLNSLLARTLPFVPRTIVRRVASRYVAGETLDDAVETVRRLNAERCLATLDVLGEDVVRMSETEETVTEYRRALDAIAAHGLDANISVKLTALGLKLDPARCREQFGRILEAASARGIFVRIDMEDSSVTEETIRIYEESLRSKDRVGLVLQAYLRRSRDDARRAAARRANVRVCKGIYVEPPEIAYQGRQEIRDNFAAMVDALLEAGSYVGIATHDEWVVARALATIARLSLAREAYEFQMLLGVREDRADELVAAGHRLRVYVPFGREWYGYSLRRLQENPKVAGYIARDTLGRLLP